MKLGIIASVTTLATLIGALVFATLSSTQVEAADACLRKDFKTEMVRDACAKGGQRAAKDAMKAFNKEKKLKSCNLCHSKLAPTYELKADGLEQFKKLGGKLIDAASGKDTVKVPPPAKETPKTVAPVK
jgi:hypothetical protein